MSNSDNKSIATELKNLKEAIIDLYLAIKIRSTEELDKIDESHLEKEKKKLLKQDGFQILEYIRSSIEIIMNLKIEDLEKEMSMKKQGDSGNDMNSSSYSVTSASFVHASMKEALANSQHGHVESQKGNLVRDDNNSKKNSQQSEEPPKEYEKMLQKLESDIRGHIRLEHEMKIHLDYLEGRVEELENQNVKFEKEKKRLDKQFLTQEEKFKILTQETQDQIKAITKEKIQFQEKFEHTNKQLQDTKVEFEREIDKFKTLATIQHQSNQIHSGMSMNQQNISMLPNVNLNYSVDYSTLPQNQHSAQSNHNMNSISQVNSQVQSNSLFNDKNIYQTISEIPINKNQLQLLTRNGNNLIEKRNFMVLGHHSTKKRRNGSSKDRQSLNSGSFNGLLDYSNRQSNKNIVQNVNPYMFDSASGKKSIKKKSESIDFVSIYSINSQYQNQFGIQTKKKNKMLRNSQNFQNGSMMPHHQGHNKSMIDDQKWLMSSADSDQFNTNQLNSKNIFNDYPNGQISVNQTINVDSRQQVQFLSKSQNNQAIPRNQLQSFENLSNPVSNSRYGGSQIPSSNSFQNTKQFNQNVQQYKIKQSLVDQNQAQNSNQKKKNSVGASNRQSIDMRNIGAINLNHSQVNLQRQSSGNRPSSQLNKSGTNFNQQNQGKQQQLVNNIKIKEKSQSKLRNNKDEFNTITHSFTQNSQLQNQSFNQGTHIKENQGIINNRSLSNNQSKFINHQQ
ncbi:UNKNOWN [Stylonychia lemnae]|uniref:Uncharacterized protein n=1 Tax=Stylonychia lemnae TaxID=5949 RepID=A0A078ACJ6_STYLE|nr:UNKNOWN [Stylonychia lemnae]|eukprot:CDW79975.1 UNKNOWN [Stylonychia lemnae]